MRTKALPTWDLSALYKNQKEWQKDFDAIRPLADEFLGCKGTLAKSAQNLKKAFDLLCKYNRLVEKVYTFAYLKADEDTRIAENQARKNSVISLLAQLSENDAWFQPEILAIPEKKIAKYVNSPTLSLYKLELTRLLRNRPHSLSEAENRILGLYGEALSAAEKTFSMLNNADISFGKVKTETGEMLELTHGSYMRFLISPDRATRRRAFRRVYETYGKLRNTCATTLNAHVGKAVVSAKVHKHPSALEMSLFGDNVPKEVYLQLIDTVHAHLPALQEYMRIRAKALGLKKMEMWDLFVPLVKGVDKTYSWDEAVAIVKAALQPLGKEYMEILERAFAERWIDVPERPGKRSGAYSGGCYDSYPYMLLNFNGTLNDVFTLAHEAGHSLHSYLSKHNQKYPYSEYKIFVAEVASTTNEILLAEYLLKNSKDVKMKRYLLTHLADEIRATIYRQTQFAEFELKMHQEIENGGSLTADRLDEIYYDINETYYDIKADRLIAREWERIPHFYYNFYVYKYATGMSAAIQLVNNILHGTAAQKKAYIGFLKAGCSKDVLDIMKDAGVDLTSPKPVATALDYFKEIIRQLL